MLKGHLDNVTTSGYIEGWACDIDNPARALEIAVSWNGVEVAWGLSHRFREDLMGAGFGLGWCAFKLRLLVSPADIRTGPVSLLERSTGSEIFAVKQVDVIEDREAPIESLDGLTTSDPTVITGIWQLRKCEQLLMQFIRRHGVESFLDAAYAYVLGRAADAIGRGQYTRYIRQATLTPVGILEALGDSDEFRSSTRKLAAPNSPGFPFV